MMFVSDLRQVGGVHGSTLVSSTNTIDRRDITEILLRVALSTINHQISEMNNLNLFNDFKFNVTVDVGCENTAMEDNYQQDICFCHWVRCKG
jgi:hypothetical protein